MYRDFSIQQVDEWQWVAIGPTRLTASTEAGLIAAIDQYHEQKGAR
jgi:hypothetical protein